MGAWDQAQGGGKPFVAVCVPHMGSVSLEFSHKMWGPLRYVAVPAFEKAVIPIRGLPWPVARNSLVKEALKEPKVTHLMWIDSDIVFENPGDPNQAIANLIAADVPIVSGVYRARKKDGFCYSMWIEVPSGFVPVEQWSGNFIEVSVVGFGCTLVKREVFEAIPYPWFEWAHESPSEDFNFCLKAAEHGYKINVFTDIRASHVSGMLKVTSEADVTTLDV